MLRTTAPKHLQVIQSTLISQYCNIALECCNVVRERTLAVYIAVMLPTSSCRLGQPTKVIYLYNTFICSLGETTAIDDPSTEKCYGPSNLPLSKYHLLGCNARGRYLTIQSFKTSVQLSLCEVAVHRRPIGYVLNINNMYCKFD